MAPVVATPGPRLVAAPLRIAPVLVPVTAACWVLLMVGAIVTYLRHGGFNKLVELNLIYLALAAFIAWGRFSLASFTA